MFLCVSMCVWYRAKCADVEYSGGGRGNRGRNQLCVKHSSMCQLGWLIGFSLSPELSESNFIAGGGKTESPEVGR